MAYIDLSYEGKKKFFGPLWIKMMKELKDMYDIEGRYNMLDIGCGKGVLTEIASKSLGIDDVVGISILEDEVEFSKKAYPQFDFFNMNVENMSFKDNEFDLIFSRGSYRFWKNKTKAFSEVYRVLRPGGFALIGGGFGRINPKEDVKEARKNLGNFRGKSGADSRIPYPSRERLAQMISDAGVKEFDFTPEDYPGMWITFSKKAREA